MNFNVGSITVPDWTFNKLIKNMFVSGLNTIITYWLRYDTK